MAARCAAENADHPQYLLRLAELELIDRHQRMVERRIRAARFPTVKSLDTFDFPAIPSVNKSVNKWLDHTVPPGFGHRFRRSWPIPPSSWLRRLRPVPGVCALFRTR